MGDSDVCHLAVRASAEVQQMKSGRGGKLFEDRNAVQC
jgi:hypothetical protein